MLPLHGAIGLKRNWLIILQSFNGLSAVAGGIALMTGAIAMPLRALSHTGFPDYYFPGVILFAVVGGSAIIAVWCLLKQTVDSALVSMSAGVVMLCWIIGEIASIREFHWLQAIYLITGALIIWLSSGDD